MRNGFLGVLHAKVRLHTPSPPCFTLVIDFLYDTLYRGISAAVHGRPARVILTDLSKETMANLRHNIDLNRQRYPPDVEVCSMLKLEMEDRVAWIIHVSG